jgi:hypothetical protein
MAVDRMPAGAVACRHIRARLCGKPQRSAIESIIDADPVAAWVREIMAQRSSWTGSAADLLRAGADCSSDGIPRGSAGWPKNRARSPAVCAAHKRSYGPLALWWPSGAKATPEAGSSGCIRCSQTPSAPSAASATAGHHSSQDDPSRNPLRRDLVGLAQSGTTTADDADGADANAASCVR